MDKSVVSDLLVSKEDADLAISKRITALEKCSENSDHLSIWYDKTIEVLDGAFASGATKYFRDMSGFKYTYYVGVRRPKKTNFPKLK